MEWEKIVINFITSATFVGDIQSHLGATVRQLDCLKITVLAPSIPIQYSGKTGRGATASIICLKMC
jgi:hypothetical protein